MITGRNLPAGHAAVSVNSVTTLPDSAAR